MIVCGYEKFSMVDYDKYIACTMFTGGCNFRCPFCHNGALVVGDLKEQQIDIEEVFDYIEKRKGMIDAVCITGGEPTLQKDLIDVYRRVKKLGLKTKLDSNGLKPEVIKELLDENLLDYVAMDIKNSRAKYAMTVGLDSVDLGNIDKSIEILKSSNINYEFRTTLIKEFHTVEDMEEISEWIKGAKNYFIQKYKDNDGCLGHGFNEVDIDDLEAYKKPFEGKVQNFGVRGY